jgi:hypothetical protein
LAALGAGTTTAGLLATASFLAGAAFTSFELLLGGTVFGTLTGGLTAGFLEGVLDEDIE